MRKNSVLSGFTFSLLVDIYDLTEEWYRVYKAEDQELTPEELYKRDQIWRKDSCLA